MKKLISVLLTLVLVCSVCVVSTGAASVNVAPTSTPQLFYSDEPYEDVTPVNGYVIGYIGDADCDGGVSVLDATAIQMHIAQLSTLSENGYELADVDFDYELSVLDATGIQMFIAQLSDSEYITHTLYYDDFIEYTFDQIAEYLIEYGDFVEDEDSYYCTTYSPTDMEDAQYDLAILYYPESRQLFFYSTYYRISEDLYIDTGMLVDRGDPVFNFGFKIYDNDYTYADAYGYSELIDDDEMTFDTVCTSLESDYYSDFSEIQELCDAFFSLAIAEADELMWDYIYGYVTDIFW